MCLCGGVCQRASPAEKHNTQRLPIGLEDCVKADPQQKVMTSRPARGRGTPECSQQPIQSKVLLFLCLDPVCLFGLEVNGGEMIPLGSKRMTSVCLMVRLDSKWVSLVLKWAPNVLPRRKRLDACRLSKEGLRIRVRYPAVHHRSINFKGAV